MVYLRWMGIYGSYGICDSHDLVKQELTDAVDRYRELGFFMLQAPSPMIHPLTVETLSLPAGSDARRKKSFESRCSPKGLEEDLGFG